VKGQKEKGESKKGTDKTLVLQGAARGQREEASGTYSGKWKGKEGVKVEKRLRRRMLSNKVNHEECGRSSLREGSKIDPIKSLGRY